MSLSPAEVRDANWNELRDGVTDALWAVHAALAAGGPCTTRELAGTMGHALEYVRPRVTELCQVSLAVCVGRRRRGRVSEGVYRARSLEEWRAAFEAGRAPEQLLMSFSGGEGSGGR